MKAQMPFFFNHKIFSSYINHRIYKQSNMIFLFLVALAPIFATSNLLLDAGFEENAIIPNVEQEESNIGPDIWIGDFLLIANDLMNGSQYTELRNRGKIEQQVLLPTIATYILTFDMMVPTDIFANYELRVKFDKTVLEDIIPNTTDVISKYYEVNVTKADATHKVYFEERGKKNYFGSCIDDVVLVLDQPIVLPDPIQVAPTKIVEDKKEQIFVLEDYKNVAKLPLNQMGPVKWFGIFIDDLWLYNYDRRNYSGTLKTVFRIGNEIEQAKWSLLNLASRFKINDSMIPVTDLAQYSNDKHMEADSVDDCFFRGAFAFFIFSIPQSILLCVIFFLIFKLLCKYKVSIVFRRYCFILPVMVQMLFENNFAFFTYLFFRQTNLFFAFKFMDKLFLAITVSFYFGVFLVLGCFYSFFNKRYKKKFGYFIHCFYRCWPSFIFLTIKTFVRNFLRGVIHSTLHYRYGTLIAALSSVEVIVISLAIYIETRKTIFLTKTAYCLMVLYHSILILLNISLYYEEKYKLSSSFGTQMQGVFNKFQEQLIFSNATLIGVLFIVEIIPFEWIKAKKIGKQEKSVKQNSNLNSEVDFGNRSETENQMKEDKIIENQALKDLIIEDVQSGNNSHPIIKSSSNVVNLEPHIQQDVIFERSSLKKHFKSHKIKKQKKQKSVKDRSSPKSSHGGSLSPGKGKLDYYYSEEDGICILLPYKKK